jgi:hypothetical protein
MTFPSPLVDLTARAEAGTLVEDVAPSGILTEIMPNKFW